MGEIQLEIKDESRKKVLTYVKADDCVLSRFNTRKTRDKDDIKQLAQRIERNGFEVTRALWAHKKDGKYEVFAGGNRLEAVRLTSYSSNMPILLHEGYSDKEIAQLETQDNENDEYHKEVSVIDIWAEYARLRDEERWSQKEIANVKNVSRSVVGDRIRFFDRLPKEIKDFVCRSFLSEQHLRLIMQLSVDRHFSSWLTTEQLWIKLAKWSKTKTTRETKEEVDRWKEIIEAANAFYQELSETGIERAYKTEDGKEICVETEYSPKDDFVSRLAEKKPDTKRKVQNIINEIKKEWLKASIVK